MTVQATTPAHIKVALRKLKTVPNRVKVAIYKGCLKAPEGTIQFCCDVQTYGLYEAILYVENYEGDGFFREGTAMDAITAYCAGLRVRS